jgi:hypothetical protein
MKRKIPHDIVGSHVHQGQERHHGKKDNKIEKKLL